ncbi:MAG: hypothetical protein INF84_11975 [Roseomonas sp.]|nr:hypothetical protein [Roseomonas sp.]
MSLQSLPGGCWPVLVRISGDQVDLFWTYFLSSTSHAWRLDQGFSRLLGRGVSRRELEELQHHFSSSSSGFLKWALTKTSGERISLASLDDLDPDNPFFQLEVDFIRILLSSQGDSNMNASALFEAFCISSLNQSYHEKFLTVSPGYDDPLNFDIFLTRKGSHEKFSRITFLHRQLCGEFLSTLRWLASLNFFSVQLGGFTGFRDVHSVVIRVEPNERVISILLSEKLLIDSNVTGSVSRIRRGLGMIWPEILRLACAMRRRFELPLSFGDGSFDDFLCFDRQIGEEKKLLPDLYLLGGMHSVLSRTPYISNLSPEIFKEKFLLKKNKLFWRGSTTGRRILSLGDLQENHRVKACLYIRDSLQELADCKIVNLVQIAPESIIGECKDLLKKLGIFGERVKEECFSEYKLFLDIPGNVAAWGTFRRYLQGCLVFRVDSDRELFYYAHQTPWVHFIPVSRDLSDLAEHVRWALDHQEEASRIAYQGRSLMVDLSNNISEHVYGTFLDYLSEKHANELGRDLINGVPTGARF